MPIELGQYPRGRLSWAGAVRIQAWRHPEVTIWRDLVDEEDLPAILEILRITEPEVYRALGDLERLDDLEWMQGEGAGWVMPAFTFGGPGRFNDETFGAFYAARERETAIAETVYHQERLLAATREEPMEARMRVLRADVEAGPCLVLHEAPMPPELYHPTDYSLSQVLGSRTRAAGLRGIRFRSVRRLGGHCAALYHPADIARCSSSEMLAYLWDGQAITAVETRTPIDWS